MSTLSKENTTMTVLTVMLFSFMLFFWGGIETIMRNEEIFPFNFIDVVMPLVLIFIVSFLVITSVILFVWRFKDGCCSEIILSLLLSLSTVMWLQVALMNGNIGLLDGEELLFSRRQMLFNGMVWLLIPTLVLFLWKYKKAIWKKSVFFFSATLFIMQFFTFVFLLPEVNSDGFQEFEEGYILSRENEFVLSQNENTIVFVLDAMGTDILRDTMNEFEHLEYMFKDFTRFDNSATLYSGTFPTMAYLLTRQRYDFSRPTRDHLYYIWSHPDVIDFYGALRERNHGIHIFANPRWFTHDTEQLEGIADNLSYGEQFTLNHLAFVQNTIRLSAFRYSPLIFKERLTPSGRDFQMVVVSNRYTGNDPLLYERLRSIGISLISERNMFVFYHMTGSHRGGRRIRINEFANIDSEATRNQQTAGALWIVNEYMDQMRELGIYDRSNIIIMADHGRALTSSASFMIKRAGTQQDAMLISNAPISHEDFWPTLVEIMNLETKDFGYSVFDIQEDEIRIRTTSHWIWYPGFPNTENTYNGFLIHTYEGCVSDEVVSDIENRDGRRLGEGFDPRLYNLEMHPIYDSFYGGGWERR